MDDSLGLSLPKACKQWPCIFCAVSWLSSVGGVSHFPVTSSQLGPVQISLHTFTIKGYFIRKMIFSPNKCDASIVLKNATRTFIFCNVAFTVHVRKSPKNICCCELAPCQTLTASEPQPVPVRKLVNT